MSNYINPNWFSVYTEYNKFMLKNLFGVCPKIIFPPIFIDKMKFKKYRLKKDLPQLSKGVIFEHRPYDNSHPDRGNPGNGCMILAWNDGGMCQYFTYKGKTKSWCGNTYIFPGQLAEDREWFEPLELSKKEIIMEKIEDLKRELEKL